ncbi:hypothetical protein D9M72_410090 [compost metagenome]
MNQEAGIRKDAGLLSCGAAKSRHRPGCACCRASPVMLRIGSRAGQVACGAQGLLLRDADDRDGVVAIHQHVGQGSRRCPLPTTAAGIAVGRHAIEARCLPLRSVVSCRITVTRRAAWPTGHKKTPPKAGFFLQGRVAPPLILPLQTAARGAAAEAVCRSSPSGPLPCRGGSPSS